MHVTEGFRPRGKRWREYIAHKFLFCCAALSVVVTMGIVFILAREALDFFQTISLQQFFGGTVWTPLFEPAHFGVWPLVTGTLLVVVIGACVALPLGLCCAMLLSEYMSDNTRKIAKPVLEVLAGIPTIVYGYFALTFVTPLLRSVIPDVGVLNALSAGLVMGIMMLPMVSSMSEDAMLAVPRSLRLGAYALGASKFDVVRLIVVPAALSGISSACILALSRAIGETMIVAIAAGSTPVFTFDPRQSIQTMTGYIAQVSLGETPQGTVVFQAIFAVCSLLFLITICMNLLSFAIVQRWRNKY